MKQIAGSRSRGLACCFGLGALLASSVQGQQILPPFNDNYVLTNIGQVPGVPLSYAAVVFDRDNPDALLIGGGANQGGGAIYSVPVLRNATNHITGFAAPAVVWATAPYVDGGASFHGLGTLFVSQYPLNQIAQFLPGSGSVDRTIALDDYGVTESVSGLTFVPWDYPGEGSLKVLTYSSGKWYDVVVVPESNGTFGVAHAEVRATIRVGSDAMLYVPPGSPEFIDYRCILVTEWDAGAVGAYDLDDAGDPKPWTRREFANGMRCVEGITADPRTGDFVIGTSGLGLGPNRVYVVRGFGLPVSVQSASWARTKSAFR